jgi:hypothetical protein
MILKGNLFCAFFMLAKIFSIPLKFSYFEVEKTLSVAISLLLLSQSSFEQARKLFEEGEF